jgi:hypothetical protein
MFAPSSMFLIEHVLILVVLVKWYLLPSLPIEFERNGNKLKIICSKLQYGV